VVNLAMALLRIGGLRSVEITKYLGFGAAVVAVAGRVALLGILSSATSCAASTHAGSDPEPARDIRPGDGRRTGDPHHGGAPPLSASDPAGVSRFGVPWRFPVSRYRAPDPGRVAVVLSGVWCCCKTSFGRVVRAGIQRPIWSPPSASAAAVYDAIVMLASAMAALAGRFFRADHDRAAARAPNIIPLPRRRGDRPGSAVSGACDRGTSGRVVARHHHPLRACAGRHRCMWLMFVVLAGGARGLLGERIGEVRMKLSPAQKYRHCCWRASQLIRLRRDARASACRTTPDR